MLRKLDMQKKVVTGKMGRYYKIKYEKVVTGMMERCYKIKYKKVVPANIHGDPTFDDINNQDPNCDDQLEENIECTCTCREQSQINK